ncbi:MalY/PatB family protein [Rudaeicoccus suwonensis]|uniref:cysteine-S-conjugate beta-lyase n=1 Tax=Rudaeicoccus suwonensis TaxID=657409 RepID=A0A561ECE0_9MICO|nr:aminotransferase class I/II-fold pyridoxal phosphate-dependent enzyme [Rudaeicoccus suwonensis]TWE13286.1 aminotransferase/cystathionine beta-lyase [Rudaeicoccus suwonensis]
MDFVAALQDLTTDRLRERGSLKWTVPGPDQLGAFVAESDLPMAPVIRAALDDALDRGLTGYLPPATSEVAEAACADFQRSRFGWQVGAEQVHLLPDVLAALSFSASFIFDTRLPIVLPTPAYMPFLDLPGVLGRPLRTVPMERVSGRYSLDPERLGQALAGGGLLVLVNPHNPTGQVATRAELLQIADVVERTGSVVFCDEIHSPLVYYGSRHIPYASLDDRTAAHSVTAVSASKGWNLPGLACAQLILGSREQRRRWDEAPMVARHGTSPLGAVAAAAAYSPSGVDHLDQAIAYLQSGRDLFAQAVATRMPHVGYTPPAATYIHWLDLGGTDMSAAELTERSGVLGTDGTDCGATGFMRLTLATTHAVIADAADRLAVALSR